MFGIPSLFFGPLITLLVSLFKRIPWVDSHAKTVATVLAAGAAVAATFHQNPAADLLTGISQAIVPAATAVSAAIATHEIAKPISDAIAGKPPVLPSSPLQGK